MKVNVLVISLVLSLLPLSRVFAKGLGAAGTIELPLPYRGDTVRKPINKDLLVIVSPDLDEGLDIKAVDIRAGSDSSNLFYHSIKWHGSYPSQVYAWQVEKKYFPNSRWVCVSGFPIEVHIIIKQPKIRKVGKVAVFQGGTLIVAWFNRPCTRGFGYESDALNTSLH